MGCPHHSCSSVHTKISGNVGIYTLDFLCCGLKMFLQASRIFLYYACFRYLFSELAPLNSDKFGLPGGLRNYSPTGKKGHIIYPITRSLQPLPLPFDFSCDASLDYFYTVFENITPSLYKENTYTSTMSWFAKATHKCTCAEQRNNCVELQNIYRKTQFFKRVLR